ncbi:DUF5995 family protein [Nocardia sp. IFM 10818]
MRKTSRLAVILVATAAVLGSAAGTAVAVDPPATGSHSPAIEPVRDAELAELVRLSDPGTLTDLHDGEQRMNRIAEIFTGHKDRRGIFAVFYRNILRDANPLLDQGRFDDPVWARKVSYAFFHEYLANLHGHLTGGPVTPGWQRYYAMAADPARSAGRVAGAGLDAHLLIDFPKAIAETGTRLENTRDFFTIGDALIGTTHNITDELKAEYGAQLADFFNLYFVGKAGDVVLGDGNTSYVLFQSVRGTALSQGIAMKNELTCGPAELSMQGLYYTAEAVFDGLEAAGWV